jgi:5-methyltetrahydrofolate--homocysteine methyltransferase
MSVIEEIIQAVINGDNGLDPLVIIHQGLVAGMDMVGPRFKNGEMFILEVL